MIVQKSHRYISSAKTPNKLDNTKQSLRAKTKNTFIQQSIPAKPTPSSLSQTVTHTRRKLSAQPSRHIIVLSQERRTSEPCQSAACVRNDCHARAARSGVTLEAECVTMGRRRKRGVWTWTCGLWKIRRGNRNF